MDNTSLVHPDKKARKPALDRESAMRLAAQEYDRVVTVLAELTSAQWAQATTCPGWDVRAMSGHILGMAQMVASVPELARQQMASQKSAKRSGDASIDTLTALQVAKNARLTTEQVVQQMRTVAPRAVRGRRRMPAVVRNRRMPEAQDVGGQRDWWTFGYLFDVILTRDPFMHRIDICRATGLPIQAAPDHEGVLVDDVVREWAERHGAAVTLELSGPAGGRWEFGDDERLSMDAFDFCRTLSGREHATGLLAQQVPF